MSRALAINFGADIRGLEQKRDTLKAEFEDHTKKNYDAEFNLNMLPALEVYFRVSINVYTLHENGHADVRRISKCDYTRFRVEIC